MGASTAGYGLPWCIIIRTPMNPITIESARSLILKVGLGVKSSSAWIKPRTS